MKIEVIGNQTERGKWPLRVEAEGRVREGHFYVTEKGLVNANGLPPFVTTTTSGGLYDLIETGEEDAILNKEAHEIALEKGLLSFSASHWEGKIAQWERTEQERVKALPPPPPYEEWVARVFPTADAQWGQGMTGESCLDMYNKVYVQPRRLRPAPKAWQNALERAHQAGL